MLVTKILSVFCTLDGEHNSVILVQIVANFLTQEDVLRSSGKHMPTYTFSAPKLFKLTPPKFKSGNRTCGVL